MYLSGMPESDLAGTVYLKWGRLRELMEDKFGPATRPQMARRLGIPYLMLWRLSTEPKNGEPRYACNDKVKAAIRAVFPDEPTLSLFEAAPDKPRRRIVRTEVETLHTVAELAAQWRVSEDHIYRLIADDTLIAVDIGINRTKLRVPASSAVAYQKSLKSKSAKAAA
jgi:hypothetical protein